MARIATLTEFQPTTHRKKHHREYDPSPAGDVSMEQILGNMPSKPWEQEVKKIDSLPDIRRNKVLSIRSQIRKGTYPVEDRLDRAADRILEDIFT